MDNNTTPDFFLHLIALHILKSVGLPIRSSMLKSCFPPLHRLLISNYKYHIIYVGWRKLFRLFMMRSVWFRFELNQFNNDFKIRIIRYSKYTHRINEYHFNMSEANSINNIKNSIKSKLSQNAAFVAIYNYYYSKH